MILVPKCQVCICVGTIDIVDWEILCRQPVDQDDFCSITGCDYLWDQLGMYIRCWVLGCALVLVHEVHS